MATDEGHQGERRPDDDPTAEFLAAVRPEATPWRVDRPSAGQDSGELVPGDDPRPERWQPARAVARAAGRTAPFVQGATFGALAAGAVADSEEDGPGQSIDSGDNGFDLGGTDGG